MVRKNDNPYRGHVLPVSFIQLNKELAMASMDEQILRAAKEVVVKFIEAGRVSPAGFSETFKSVYQTIDETARGIKPEASEEDPGENP